MDASEYLEAFDVGIKINQKVRPKSLVFVLVKIETLDKVALGELKNLKPHSMASLICFLASSQSIN